MTLLICIRIFCVWRLMFELDQTFNWNVSISPWQIFDKLCQSFGGDVLQVLFNSAEGVASCAPENMAFELMRFILDQTIAVVAFNILFFWKIVKCSCYKFLDSQPQQICSFTEAAWKDNPCIFIFMLLIMSFSMHKKQKRGFKCLHYIYVGPISDKIVDLMCPN